MTRVQRDAARGAVACFGLVAIGLLMFALCAMGGCGGPADAGERAGLVSR